jgi:hypothetical protein
VIGDEIEQGFIAAQICCNRRDAAPAPRKQFERFDTGAREMHMVLMRTEITVPDELGHPDLEIDRPTHRVVARPFGKGRVIWRRGRKRDDARIGQALDQRLESVPPFASQMMCFVEN